MSPAAAVVYWTHTLDDSGMNYKTGGGGTHEFLVVSPRVDKVKLPTNRSYLHRFTLSPLFAVMRWIKFGKFNFSPFLFLLSQNVGFVLLGLVVKQFNYNRIEWNSAQNVALKRYSFCLWNACIGRVEHSNMFQMVQWTLVRPCSSDCFKLFRTTRPGSKRATMEYLIRD